MEAEVPEIFVEVPETRAEREHFDPGLAGASAEALHAAATGAVRIDRGIEASKPGGEGQGGKVVRQEGGAHRLSQQARSGAGRDRAAGAPRRSSGRQTGP